MKLEIVRLISSDRQWTEEVFQTHWGAGVVVSRGKVHRASDLDGYVACSGKERVGLATFVIQKDQCEIVTLNSFVEGQGIGTALVNAVQARARKSGCRRVWLITTNDNLNALRFY